MTKTTAAITAVGGYVPEDVLTNHDLEKLVDTNDEWIRSRTGIEKRHILKGERGSSYMATKAVEIILKEKNLDPLDIDLIICGTVTPDYPFPSTACLVANNIGAKNAWAYDVNAACSGFIYSLSQGAQFIETGKYKKVIVIGVDKMSSIINYEDRATCIIFGDGGGAVLLEPTEDGTGVLDSILKADGGGHEFLHQKAGGSLYPASEATIRNNEHYVFQEGKTVFKFAVTNMADVSAKIMEQNNLTSDDIRWLVPHQANKRIIDATASRMGLESEKVMLNIAEYGNTTAGTLPLCLWDYRNQLQKGDNIILSAFGGGFTWGAVYVKWAYDPA